MRYDVKKIFGFFKLRYVYIYFFLYLILDYFFNGKIRNTEIFNVLKDYLGIVSIPLIFIMTVFVMVSPYMNTRTKKMLLSVRLHCFFILSISILYMFFMCKLQLPFEKEIADSTVIEKFLQLGIYKYRIGFMSAYVFYLILINIPYLYIYIGLGVLIFCTAFLISAKPVKMTIKRIYHNYQEKKRIEYEQQLLREQIAIKEALEKREILIREKREQDKENKIKERVEEVLAKKELILESYSIDENNNNDIIKEQDIDSEESSKTAEIDLTTEITEEVSEESSVKNSSEAMPSDMAFETMPNVEIEKEEKEDRKLLTIKLKEDLKGEQDDTSI